MFGRLDACTNLPHHLPRLCIELHQHALARRRRLRCRLLLLLLAPCMELACTEEAMQRRTLCWLRLLSEAVLGAEGWAAGWLGGSTFRRLDGWAGVRAGGRLDNWEAGQLGGWVDGWEGAWLGGRDVAENKD